jgi:hypothetical protein
VEERDKSRQRIKEMRVTNENEKKQTRKIIKAERRKMREKQGIK